MDFIHKSGSMIRAVLIFDAEYPQLTKATISLLVADDDGRSHWERYREVIHDDHLSQQPSGQVEFYLSDFLGPKGLPVDFCRPPVGISRSPYFTIPYESFAATFRTARYLRHPDVFAMRDEDKAPNAFQDMQDILDRRSAEAGRRLEESDKRTAEYCRQLAEERRRRKESDQRAAEYRRQVEESDQRAAEYRRQIEALKRQMS